MTHRSRADGAGGGARAGAAETPHNRPLVLPPRLPPRRYRPAQPNIPNDRAVRERLRDQARGLVQQAKLVPPLALDELYQQAEQVCRALEIDRVYRDYAAIIVNNEVWRDTLARIPYERRLLLLPQCLRSASACGAEIDEYGLVCAGCGRCAIHQLQSEAERLGYAVLVAEGAAVVTKLIESGQIEAIVGVSCMSVLEKCFPHMEARAVPALAIPLLQDGCADTTVDLDWVRDAIHLTSTDRTYRLDLDALRRCVRDWFVPEVLNSVAGAPEGETEAIARDWLTLAGKRWRPYLAVCACLSLQEDLGEPSTVTLSAADDLKKLAIAVECFHKASLIHDDIEDGDEKRYGQPALHSDHGVPVALNVGDFLLGEGYRLIGELEVAAQTKVAMLHIAAHGHLTLSRGQGAELCWARHPAPLSPLEVLDMFRQKTAPAFEVALRLGACYGGADAGVHDVLTRYSEALGIAYQIRDDLEDFAGAGDSHDLRDLRPSVVLAIAHKRAVAGDEARLTTALWRGTCDYTKVAAEIEQLLREHEVLETAESLLEAYTAQATRALHPLQSATLKGLLRRVLGRIFGDKQIRGYCREFEARNAGSRTAGPDPAA
ncbi:MAG: polyprenyl synthetase family protein [Planctomycetes bacterium]|nr:polyprenyl synthetase family protein [Planctomycetota bacterium]